jgi:hypothetical protein
MGPRRIGQRITSGGGTTDKHCAPVYGRPKVISRLHAKDASLQQKQPQQFPVRRASCHLSLNTTFVSPFHVWDITCICPCAGDGDAA